MICNVVMLLHNALPVALAAMQHLIACTSAELRFVLIDNASTEATERLGKLLPAPHILVRNEENVGVYKGLNQALRRCEQEYVILCASDHLVLPNWFLLCHHALEKFGFVWMAPGWKEGPYHYREAWDAAEIPRDLTVTPRFASSCALVNWKRLKEAVGEFDEQFFFVFGDADYRVRLQDAGLGYGVVEGNWSHHLGSQSRRSVGLDQDLAWQLGDAARFREKYAARPDVLATHPGLDLYTPAHVDELGQQQAALWIAQDPGPL